MDLVASLIAILSFTCALHSVRSYATLRPTLSAPKKVVDIYNLVPDQRLVSYEDGTAMQRAMFDRIVKHQFDEHRLDQGRVKVGEVLLLQHSPVYTLGSGTKATSGPFSPLTADGEVLKYDTIAVDRAGDATYHGPGQVVIYPVLDLGYFGKDINWYLRMLEQTVIDLAAELQVVAHRIARPGYTGVWVNNAKIAAIGLKVSRWVTTHGVSVNVNPDMRYFRNIVPCGISDSDKRVGALADFCPAATVEAVALALERHLLRLLGAELGCRKQGEVALSDLNTSGSVGM